MSWIKPEDKMPPEGLYVLVEMSGYGTGDKGERIVADHSFYLATWIHPVGKDQGEWFIESTSDYWSPTVHAWMPLPRHYEAPEHSEDPEDDMMEHAMFEEDPEWLYKDDAVYEQMTLEELWNN